MALLLISAITTNLVLIFRFDRASECYANAMRIMERAILQYLSDDKKPKDILYRADDEAEQSIANKFF